MKDNTKREKRTRSVLILDDIECLKEGNMNEVKGSTKMFDSNN